MYFDTEGPKRLWGRAALILPYFFQGPVQGLHLCSRHYKEQRAVFATSQKAIFTFSVCVSKEKNPPNSNKSLPEISLSSILFFKL